LARANKRRSDKRPAQYDDNATRSTARIFAIDYAATATRTSSRTSEHDTNTDENQATRPLLRSAIEAGSWCFPLPEPMPPSATTNERTPRNPTDAGAVPG
jgi:hypothetical protein